MVAVFILFFVFFCFFFFFFFFCEIYLDILYGNKYGFLCCILLVTLTLNTNTSIGSNHNDK